MTDANRALAQIKAALADPAMTDPGASTHDTLAACRAFQDATIPENMRALLARLDAQAAEIEQARRTADYWKAEHLAGNAEIERLRADAERYREWLRGGPNIPPESSRWRRWEVRYWDGRYWQTLFGDDLDAAIDEARKA